MSHGGTLTVGLAVAAGLAALAMAGPWLAPHDPQAITGPALASPSDAHWLGTNVAGQDVASRLLAGARVSLVTALLAAAAATAAGVALGATAGLLRGWVDTAAMRTVDFFLAVPGLPLMILVAALVGPSRPTIVAVIALAGWPPIARIVRSQTLVVAQAGWVRAARGFGGARRYLLARHVIPALAPLIVAGFVNWAAVSLVLEAGLAFLGLGAPTAVSWGAVLQRSLADTAVYASGAWTWWVLPAGAAVTVAAVGLALVGVGLEPRANPRWARP